MSAVRGAQKGKLKSEAALQYQHSNENMTTELHTDYKYRLQVQTTNTDYKYRLQNTDYKY